MRSTSDLLLTAWLIGATLLVSTTVMAFSGCEQEERVLDLEAPGVDIEVNKDKDGRGGSVELETDPEADN